jgi:hypothetical protein
VTRWAEQRAGQQIFLTTPTVLVGYRAEVYRVEGTTQWYTAVIVGFSQDTGEFTVTDDTVLEEHYENPGLVQMRILGEGVIESILGGEDISVAPRRSRASVYRHAHSPPPQREKRRRRGGPTARNQPSLHRTTGHTSLTLSLHHSSLTLSLLHSSLSLSSSLTLSTTFHSLSHSAQHSPSLHH